MGELLVFVAKGLGGLIALWVVVRVAAAAFFKSKHEIEGALHGQKQKP